MSSKLANCSVAGLAKINVQHCMNSAFGGGGRKRSAIGSPNRTDDGLSFELKGEKVECHQPLFCETSLSMSSLRVRLGPTIQSTLAAAVDTLLSEVALVLNDALTETQQELATREQENERLKLRLEVSEGELKALQECLSSAQKIIEQLPIPLPGQGPAAALHHACLPGAPADRSAAQLLGHRIQDDSSIRCLPGCDAEISRSLGEAFPGLDSGDEVKVGQLSIQADGTVTTHPLNISSPATWTDVTRTDECSTGKRLKTGFSLGTNMTGQGTPARFVIKQEQDHGPVHQSRPGAGDGLMGAPESEQSARNVGELGRIHVVDEVHPAPHSLHPEGRRLSMEPGQGKGAPQGAAGSAQLSERPHLCLECGKTFRLISSLKKHIRIHTGEKPYPCGVCGRRFRESGALKTHQRIHTGEKPYSCSDCGTSFRHLDGLRKHRRTHTGEKPYPCSVCGKRLSRLQHLKHHQRIHTGERPCRCHHCHKSFTEPAALRKHLRTHRDEPGASQPGPGTGPGAADDFGCLQATTLSPQMAFGMWGEDGEEGAALNCVEER
ncbi:uncharacterized protein [Paramormyrops kingsleyae]|uniref:uncharacterized protein n=1 Tax=Paramormyrops kingsleyae TaxID=1676925 RepID=UPI003B97750F